MMDCAIGGPSRWRKVRSLKLAVRPGAGRACCTGLLNSYAETARRRRWRSSTATTRSAALRTGAARRRPDVATSTADGLELLELGDEPTRGRAPAGHRLAARSSLAMADLHSLPGFSDALPHQPLDATVESGGPRPAGGSGRLKAWPIGWAPPSLPSPSSTTRSPASCWRPADQVHAPRAELVRIAQGLALQGRLAPVGQAAAARSAARL